MTFSMFAANIHRIVEKPHERMRRKREENVSVYLK
jgi:hypothetical protein